jgi:hypothetical protein
MKEYAVKLRKPYEFEGKSYTEIDLGGLEDLSTAQLKEADKRFTREGNIAAVNEVTLGYACIVAHLVTGLPMEFFDGLPARAGTALKNTVAGFFLNTD